MEPRTLQEAIVYFSKPENQREYLVARRWPYGVTCPRCGSKNVLFLEKYNRWHCREKHDAPQFTLKTGTIFEDSPLGLDKWLTAMWMVVNCKNGVSSWEIHRALKITQKSAWFMDHRIRLALQGKHTVKLGGSGKEVEVDETFIGGKARNMHAKRRRRMMIGQRGPINKTIVFGMKERGGDVRAHVVSERNKVTLHPIIKENVGKGSAIYTDEFNAYDGLQGEYGHQVINHAEKYVDGLVHTNGMENFWSLLKRGLNGTYVAVEPFHLFRYIDEQAFRYNNRGNKKNPVNDADRFDMAVRQIVGKRLMYKELTGKVGVLPEPEPF
ncbi:MAG TPA: IS1595 family transposase [Candidatus Angelobacter sp.]